MRSVPAIVVLLAALAACDKGDARRPPPAAPPTPAPVDAAPAPLTELQRWAIQERCEGYYQARRWDQFKTCYSPKIQISNGGQGWDPIDDLETFVTEAKNMVRAFPDIRNESHLILLRGSEIAIISRFTGTNDGPLPSEGGPGPITHRRIDVVTASIQDTDELGRLSREWGFFDSTAIVGQLGLLPAGIEFRTEQGSFPEAAVIVARGDAAEQANLATYQAALADHNRHDATALAAHYTDDLIWREAMLAHDQPRAAWLDAVRAWWRGFSDLTVTTTEAWAAGDYVFAFGMIRGHNDGVYEKLGLDRTGGALELPFLDFAHFTGGKIDRVWRFSSRELLARLLDLQHTRLE